MTLSNVGCLGLAAAALGCGGPASGPARPVESAAPAPTARSRDMRPAEAGRRAGIRIIEDDGVVLGIDSTTGRSVYRIEVPAQSFLFVPEGRAVVVAVSGTTPEERTKLTIDVFDLDSGAQLARTDWETEIWSFGVVVDPTGRWVGIREGLSIARIDSTTGRTERLKAPFDGLDNGTSANTLLAFTATGGLMCTTQNGVDHVALGPPAAPGRALLCFVDHEEQRPRDRATGSRTAHVVSVPVAPGAKILPPALGRYAQRKPWILSTDRRLVAYVDVQPTSGGALYSLVVAEPESEKPRFRVKVHESKLSPGQGPWSLDVSFDEDRVCVAGVDGTDIGATEAFGGAFDLRTGARLE